MRFEGFDFNDEFIEAFKKEYKRQETLKKVRQERDKSVVLNGKTISAEQNTQLILGLKTKLSAANQEIERLKAENRELRAKQERINAAIKSASISFNLPQLEQAVEKNQRFIEKYGMSIEEFNHMDTHEKIVAVIDSGNAGPEFMIAVRAAEKGNGDYDFIDDYVYDDPENWIDNIRENVRKEIKDLTTTFDESAKGLAAYGIPSARG